MQDFEKLGVFYLGKNYDLDKSQLHDELVLYDSKDLTTHAVIIGMTGSGKTGLGLGLIEEAAIDRIPVIAIDPKGDLGNLLLTFPDLSPEQFKPWVNAQEAATKGISGEAYAVAQADLWRKGLADWGQSAERIKKLRETADFAIYTPGSSSGLQLSILRSFNAPSMQMREDSDLYRERVQATATSLLALLNIDSDPFTSREHILISNILSHYWNQGKDLDIPNLIAAIQAPPFKEIGVMNLDLFYPSKERFALAMQLNNLIASTGFQAWREGQPLDINALMYTETGQPRVAVMSIAHLGDAERMFFVSMLLNEVLSWMRAQQGTTSLRAILYIDEIFGYMPPIANPPSKQLLLRLLKQARAFGLGIVLATQNPVDLDYKGLSNAGTWFIGRLQTERDKMRLLEGLEGAAVGGAFNRQKMEQILAGLGKRVFLMHNVHEDTPVVFQTRWTLSYLSGPLTREQIKTIMNEKKAALPITPTEIKTAPAVKAISESGDQEGSQPILPTEIKQFFVPVQMAQAPNQVTYFPKVVGACEIAFNNPKYKLQHTKRALYFCEIGDEPVPVDWAQAETANIDLNSFEKEAWSNAVFAECPASAQNPKNYSNWSKLLERHAKTNEALTLFSSPVLSAVSLPDEPERDFRIRLQQLAREHRDGQVEALRKKYAVKINTLNEQLRRAEQVIERESAQTREKQLETALSFGTALLGAFMGRKTFSASTAGKLGSAVRSAGRIGKEASDVQRAQENAAAIQQQLAQLEADLQQDIEQISAQVDAQIEALEKVTVQPKATDIYLQFVGLAWVPYSKDENGRLVQAW